jgi:RNA polymerase sigma factor (sigma-70 family)
MRAGPLSAVVRFLRAATAPSAADLTDRQLLDRFVAGRDEVAFTALVQRHGPMVLAVCGRVLPNPHDVEDAFQSTFLVLARKARAISRPERLGNWLYGVAYRTALRARAEAARRRARERQVSEMAAAAEPGDAAWTDVRAVLDEEVSRLPGKYRTPFVLCYLEGRTNAEAAQLLGCPKGTVLSRLAWARQRLRNRLTVRGLALSSAALVALLSDQAAPAAVPPALIDATSRAALLFTAGHGAAASAASPPVLALTEGVLRAMSMTKLKAAAGVLLALAVAAVGVSLPFRGPLATARAGADRDDTPAPAVREDGEALADEALADCPDELVIAETGKRITKTFKVTDFTAVHAAHAFEVEITRGDSFSVTVSADEKLMEHINVSKSDSALEIAVETDKKHIRVKGQGPGPKATITMPALEGVHADGATTFTVSGFKSTKPFKGRVSGASKLIGTLEARKLDLEVTGASGVALKGTAREGELVASGASNLALAEFALDKASVELTGACHAVIKVKSHLDYELTGASKLTYTGDPKLGTHETSAVSSVSHK